LIRNWLRLLILFAWELMIEIICKILSTCKLNLLALGQWLLDLCTKLLFSLRLQRYLLGFICDIVLFTYHFFNMGYSKNINVISLGKLFFVAWLFLMHILFIIFCLLFRVHLVFRWKRLTVTQLFMGNTFAV
jgi:hypothetical protein